MPIYSRRGDEGDTSLADGTRTSKSSLRVEAYGTIDELNSLVGLARCATDEKLDAFLAFAQQRLFNCSSALAYPANAPEEPAARIAADDIVFLETAVDHFMDTAGPFKGFVLEGGCEAAARLHVARAVCRRAERILVRLAAEAPVDAQLLAFVNRLSDALFAAARYANARAGADEELWNPESTAPEL